MFVTFLNNHTVSIETEFNYIEDVERVTYEFLRQPELDIQTDNLDPVEFSNLEPDFYIVKISILTEDNNLYVDYDKFVIIPPDLPASPLNEALTFLLNNCLSDISVEAGEAAYDMLEL